MNLPFPLQSGVNAIKAAAFARMLVVILNFMGLLKADSVASTPACTYHSVIILMTKKNKKM
tara:strand:+ start:142 stop:324 length:183 start_codon:yes stop_codon:yes gene_type:complete